MNCEKVGDSFRSLITHFFGHAGLCGSPSGAVWQRHGVNAPQEPLEGCLLAQSPLPPTHQPTNQQTDQPKPCPILRGMLQLKQTPWHPRHPLRKKPPWHPSHQRHKKPRRRRRPTPRRLQRLGSTVCIPQREKPSLTGSLYMALQRWEAAGAVAGRAGPSPHPARPDGSGAHDVKLSSWRAHFLP